MTKRCLSWIWGRRFGLLPTPPRRLLVAILTVALALVTIGGPRGGTVASAAGGTPPPIGNPPVVTGLSPSFGRQGTQVIITGGNFTRANAVNFGANPARVFTVNSDAQITVTAPPRAPRSPAIVDVRVTTPGGTSPLSSQDRFSYGPLVTGLSPSFGRQGTQVIITGDNFTGANAVDFGANTARVFTVNSDTQITVTAPPRAPRSPAIVDVRVTTPGGTGPLISPLSSQDRFSYGPLVTGLNPSFGGQGTQVIVTGANFTRAS
ncbi:MAG TPA: IPT/TIG domain-containing protein, partial [Acidimicrobiia bacterium]|nr:IPT/TIG domain-containing protein [Acidimicrobiia bacterium]